MGEFGLCPQFVAAEFAHDGQPGAGFFKCTLSGETSYLDDRHIVEPAKCLLRRS